MNTIVDVLYGVSLAFLIAMFIAAIIGGPLWLLWNWLMPVIFGLPKITFWQAVGLALMSSILFKNSTTSSSKK